MVRLGMNQTDGNAASSMQGVWPLSAQWVVAGGTALLASFLTIHFWLTTTAGPRPGLLTPSADHYRVDLNQAGRSELLQLPQLGDTLVDRILEYRQRHGLFQKPEDLLAIPGIGPARFDRLRPLIFVTGADQQGARPAIKDGKKNQKPKPKINVNTANRAELEQLPRIGPKLAQAIIAERNKRPFASIDDLDRVRGIGKKTVERLRPYVTVD
ncbi:MAG: hypothetical protein KatS3mg105_2547 [Gemmatales bacterium]|nr:MAG: hypothetical protein KatS3mg105_2547 [Gemmatales bacterium]